MWMFHQYVTLKSLDISILRRRQIWNWWICRSWKFTSINSIKMMVYITEHINSLVWLPVLRSRSRQFLTQLEPEPPKKLRLQLYLKSSKLLEIVSLISDNIIIFDIHIPHTYTPTVLHILINNSDDDIS